MQVLGCGSCSPAALKVNGSLPGWWVGESVVTFHKAVNSVPVIYALVLDGSQVTSLSLQQCPNVKF